MNKQIVMKPLQSGGFADVLLNQETNICYKIFHRRGSEKREFQIVRHLMEKYNERPLDDASSSRIMKYIDFGYIPKEAVLEMYQVAYSHDAKKILTMMKNFQDESYVPFVAMEYIDGMDGLEYGLKNGYFDEKMAVESMISLLLAVQEFHDLDLIHRDIKPDNFMIRRNARGELDVKLIDLGLATRKPIHDSQAVFEGHIGTDRYLSPEALKGWHSVASDLFAVGMSFYMLCGSPTDFSSKFMKLLLKLTDINPRLRGTLSETIDTLREIQREEHSSVHAMQLYSENIAVSSASTSSASASASTSTSSSMTTTISSSSSSSSANDSHAIAILEVRDGVSTSEKIKRKYTIEVEESSPFSFSDSDLSNASDLHLSESLSIDDFEDAMEEESIPLMKRKKVYSAQKHQVTPKHNLASEACL